MNELEKLYRAKLEAVGYQPKQNPPIWEMPAVTNGKNDELPPHLEAGAMVPVCNDDGKVIRLIRKADLYHMERQIAAAERLYEAVKQHSESTDVPDYLDNASSDYANAKGEK